MAWRPDSTLHRSPFKKPHAPGEGDWTLLEEKGVGVPRPSSSVGLDIPMSRMAFKSPSPTSSISSGVGRAYSVDADTGFSRHFKQSLEQAEQQTAYWQARAKEAEQSILQYKTECVSLQCQINTLQCKYKSLDDTVDTLYGRLQSIGSVLNNTEGDGSSGDASKGLCGREAALCSGLEGQKGTSDVWRSRKLAEIESTLATMQERLMSGTLGNPVDRESVIAFRSFAVGDVAFFFPTPLSDFLAFNIGCPHYYLAKESKSLVGLDRHFRKYYVLGRITRLTQCQAMGGAAAVTYDGKERVKDEDEVKGLPVGTVYWLVHLEPISDSLKASSASSVGVAPLLRKE